MWTGALDIVITFVVLITTAHCSESNPCEGRPDGSFVVNPKGCKYFFLCQNGTAIEAFCPDGMWFNPEESICDRPSNVDCHFDDPPSTTTTTKSTTTTTTATTTRMTRTTRRTTRIFKTTVTTRTTKRPSKPNRPSKRPHRPPSNQPFTPTKQPLLSPTLPSSSNQPDEKVMCPPRDMRNIKFVASKLKCDRYFICYHTRAVAQQCIEGLHWNERDNRCDHPEMAKCSVNVPRPAQFPKCPSTGHRFFPHPTECDYFIFCRNGHYTIQQCPFYHHWDTSSESCKWRKFTHCVTI